MRIYCKIFAALIAFLTIERNSSYKFSALSKFAILHTKSAQRSKSIEFTFGNSVDSQTYLSRMDSRSGNDRKYLITVNAQDNENCVQSDLSLIIEDDTSLLVHRFIDSNEGLYLDAAIVDEIAPQPSQNFTSQGIVVKSLIWLSYGSPVLVMLSNTVMVDRIALSSALGVDSIQDCRLASISIAETISGFAIGTILAIPLKNAMPVIIDEYLLEEANNKSSGFVCSGSGISGKALRFNLQSLIALPTSLITNLTISKISIDSNKLNMKSFPYDPITAKGNSDGLSNPSNEGISSTNKYIHGLSNNTSTTVPQTGSADSKIKKDTSKSKNRSTSHQRSFPYSTLRRLAASQETGKFYQILDLYDALHSDTNPLDIDDPTGSGKTALQLAAWKGKLEHIQQLIKREADINKWSTNIGNYGKTAIFYAITRCRDDIVMELLQYGAWVKIVNNKGQTPRSLGVSHLKQETVTAIEEAEVNQHDLPWLNFRESHSDGGLYGDLDPRFLEESTLRYVLSQTEHCQNSSTDQSSGINQDHMVNKMNVLKSLLDAKSVFTTTFEMRFTNQRRLQKYLDDDPCDDEDDALINTSLTAMDTASTFELTNSESCRMHPNQKDVNIDNSLIENGLLNIDCLQRLELVDRDYNIPKQLPVDIQFQLDSDLVFLQGTILSKRHVGKLLVFANIIPVNDDVTDTKAIFNYPSVVANKYTRLSWHVRDKFTKEPLSDQPIAVQLLIGKTMFKKYGEEITRSVCKCIAPGQTVLLSGKFSAVDDTNEDVLRRLRHGNTTLDFIVHDFKILHSGQLLDNHTNDFIPSKIKIDKIEDKATVKKNRKHRNTSDKRSTEEEVAIVASAIDRMIANESVAEEQVKIHHRLIVKDCYNINIIRHERQDITIYKQYQDSLVALPYETTLTDDIVVDCIHVINDLNSIQYFEESINKIILNHQENIQSYSIGLDKLLIGLDCEWRPQRQSGDDYPVALLQIGVQNQVYLIDLLQILLPSDVSHNKNIDRNDETKFTSNRSDDESVTALDRVLSSLFGYDQCVILGFGITGDLRKLHHSYPNMKCFSKYRSCLDLVSLMNNLNNSNFSSHKRGRSLSNLSNEILGKYIDKSQQCSPWHERPLSWDQITYAAIDAAILLRIYHQLLVRAKSIPSIRRKKKMQVSDEQRGDIDNESFEEKTVTITHTDTSAMIQDFVTIVCVFVIFVY